MKANYLFGLYLAGPYLTKAKNAIWPI